MSVIIKCSNRLFKDCYVFIRSFEEHATSPFVRNDLGMTNLALGYRWYKRTLAILFNQIFYDTMDEMGKKRMEKQPEMLG